MLSMAYSFLAVKPADKIGSIQTQNIIRICIIDPVLTEGLALSAQRAVVIVWLTWRPLALSHIGRIGAHQREISSPVSVCVSIYIYI